jgi:hypothetical protein
MTFDEIKALLDCHCILQHDSSPIDVQQAYATDLMSDILVSPKPGALLVTGLANNQAVRTSKVAGISAIVFVRNKKPSPETVRLSQEYNIPLLSTKLSMFEACGLLFSNGIKGISFES